MCASEHVVCDTKTVSWHLFIVLLYLNLDFPGGSDGKASVYNAGDLGLIPGLGRSPGEGIGYPLQCSGLENSMDRGAWQAAEWGCKKTDMTE